MMSVYEYLDALSNRDSNSFSRDEFGKVSGFSTFSADGKMIFRDFALLKVCVSSNRTDLLPLYRKQVAAHNEKIMKSVFPDSGFDIFFPEETTFSIPFQNQIVPFGIKTEMVYIQPGDLGKSTILPTAFDLRPRSSISKSDLILSNHVGTIDSGYRGELMGAFRWLPARHHNYVVEKHSRLLQICHPTLCPILAVVVESETDFSISERGSGGFGSTGIVSSI
jgi:dUTP pyrophosphatase